MSELCIAGMIQTLLMDSMAEFQLLHFYRHPPTQILFDVLTDSIVAKITSAMNIVT